MEAVASVQCCPFCSLCSCRHKTSADSDSMSLLMASGSFLRSARRPATFQLSTVKVLSVVASIFGRRMVEGS